MHCFAVAWNLPEEYRDRLESCLVTSTGVYETLDASSLWSMHQGPLSVVSIQSAPEHGGERCYRSIGNDGFTLVHGLCIDLQGEFSAFDARQLSRHWSRIPASVDGQFILVRGQQHPVQLEIVTDSLGVAQLYYARVAGGWAFSNSVQVLKDLLMSNELDPLGVASFLSVGWSVAQSTLVRGIECVPGGQHWCWRAPSDHPQQTSYFGRENLIHSRQAALQAEEVAALGETLLSIVRPLGAAGEVECPITAGRDSRLMTALLATAKVPAIYFTEGSEGDGDFEIGRRFAEHYALPWRARQVHESASDADWEEATWRLMRQTDGMVTLAHVANALRSSTDTSTRCVHLYGAGGEIARIGFFQDNEPLYYLFPQTHAAAKRILRRSVVSHTNRVNLIRPEAADLVTQYLDRFVDQIRDDGFSSSELEALFYLEERVRRWGGNNFRQVTSYRDVFSPYCTRAFTMAAFKVPLLYRYASHVHYELLAYLNPDMQQFPFDRSWHPQQVQAMRVKLLRHYYRQSKSKFVKFLRHLLHRADGSHSRYARHIHRASWLEQYLPQLRQRVFDQSSSPLWDYVDRQCLEQLLDPGTTALERHRSQASLFDALTLFHYQLACDSHARVTDYPTMRRRA